MDVTPTIVTKPQDTAKTALPLRFRKQIDGYRLVSQIVKHLREAEQAPRSAGTGLAQAAGVSAATLSNAEHLHVAADDGDKRRRVGRDQLLKILFDGLGMKPLHASVVLWLYDGNPLTDREFAHFVSHSRRPDLMRPELHYPQLLEYVSGRLPDPKQTLSEVRLFFRGSLPGQLDAERTLLELDDMPGQRIVVTATPTGLVAPEKDVLRGETPREQAFLRQRIQLFHERSPVYGESAMHCEECIVGWLERTTDNRERERRKRHLEAWERFVTNTNNNYRVALLTRIPDQPFLMKFGVGAMLSGLPHERHDKGRAAPKDLWGPRFVYTTDVAVQLRLLTAFEQTWYSLPKKLRSDTEAGRLHLERTLNRALGRKK